MDPSLLGIEQKNRIWTNVCGGTIQLEVPVTRATAY